MLNGEKSYSVCIYQIRSIIHLWYQHQKEHLVHKATLLISNWFVFQSCEKKTYSWKCSNYPAQSFKHPWQMASSIILIWMRFPFFIQTKYSIRNPPFNITGENNKILATILTHIINYLICFIKLLCSTNCNDFIGS